MRASAIAAVVFSLALGGCAIVTSDEPLFGEADAAGAPVLKPGLWAMPDGGCQYDEKAAARTWPRCANATVVTARTVSGGERGETGVARQVLAYVLAEGEPPVVQPRAPPDEKDGPKFIYAGLRPSAFDAERRVTAARVWLALCSRPPSPSDKSLRPPPTVLPPGLVKRPSDPSCVARSADPVRKAVARSEGWVASGGPDDFSLQAHWVRDGPD
jgi:hypothetical protein